MDSPGAAEFLCGLKGTDVTLDSPSEPPTCPAKPGPLILSSLNDLNGRRSRMLLTRPPGICMFYPWLSSGHRQLTAIRHFSARQPY